MNNNQYSIEVLVGGRPVREFSKYIDGEHRTFIEGREGSEYQIRIRNNSHKKLLAIAAVDSINVVTGSVSDGYKGRGYIISPYDSVTIKGFRESDDTVGAFKFTSKHNSYASEKGIERNCGVIAVNLIEEKEHPIKVTEIHHHHHHPEPTPPPVNPWPWKPTIWGITTTAGESYSGFGSGGGISYNCSNNISDTNYNGAPVSANFVSAERNDKFDLGSTWGNRVEDKITRKHFEKGNVVCGFKLYYASRHALESMGINFYPKKEINEWPQGFEGEYCKPPRSWC